MNIIYCTVHIYSKALCSLYVIQMNLATNQYIRGMMIYICGAQ